MALRIARTSLLLAALSLAGCWPFNRGPTPQQQFLDALKTGRTGDANQIWLNMTPEDRLKFQTGQGMTQEANPEEIKQKITQHYQDQMGSDADPGASIEQTTPDLGGSLQNLPNLLPPNGGASPQPSEQPGISN